MVELKNLPYEHTLPMLGNQAPTQPWHTDEAVASLNAHKVLTVEKQLEHGGIKETAN